MQVQIFANIPTSAERSGELIALERTSTHISARYGGPRLSVGVIMLVAAAMPAPPPAAAPARALRALGGTKQFYSSNLTTTSVSCRPRHPRRPPTPGAAHQTPPWPWPSPPRASFAATSRTPRRMPPLAAGTGAGAGASTALQQAGQVVTYRFSAEEVVVVDGAGRVLRVYRNASPAEAAYVETAAAAAIVAVGAAARHHAAAEEEDAVTEETGLAVAVEPGKYCSPRQPTHLNPRFLSQMA